MKIIIVGGGQVGFSLARHLSAEKQDVVLIEADEGRCAMAREMLDIQVLCGQGASPSLLAKAGIETASMLIAVTNSDEVNIVSCLNAAATSKTVQRIARIRSLDYIKVIEEKGSAHLGIDRVINPEIEAANSIMRMLQVPAAEDVRDFADGHVRLTAFTVEEGAPAAGRKLKDLAAEPNLANVLVVSLERNGKVIIPRGNDELHPGDYLWLLCEPNRVSEVVSYLGKHYFPLKRVTVYGGGAVGFHITKMLEELDIPTKLLEPDLARCEQLAMELEHTVVLNGQGIDLKLLREENIRESSAFVAVTDEDEENILSALLARKEGVPKVIALMERLDYESVVSTIGVNNIVSKNMAAVSMIMGNLRKGRILSSSVIGSYAEVIEYVAMETSEITGASLVDLSFPRGSIVGAIVREDEVIIPRGGDRVRPGDRVLIFALKESIPKVEKLLTVKLEYF